MQQCRLSPAGSSRAWLALLAGLAVLALGSCGTKTEAPVDPNMMPASYKSDILSSLQNTLDDPTGIRDAYIAEPALKPSGTEQRYIVCLRYNAKNADGSYAGVRERAAYFYAGRLTTIADATKEQCGSAPYQHFPELEKLCRISGCPPVRS